MKTKILNKINLLIAFLMGILGFNCNGWPFANAYGAPHADFIIEGIVVNEATEPLNNIQVLAKSGWKDNEGFIHYSDGNIVYTQIDGKFKHFLGDPGGHYKIIVNDTSNVYQSDSLDIQAHFKNGKGTWYYGSDSTYVEIVLKKNEE